MLVQFRWICVVPFLVGGPAAAEDFSPEGFLRAVHSCASAISGDIPLDDPAIAQSAFMALSSREMTDIVLPFDDLTVTGNGARVPDTAEQLVCSYRVETPEGTPDAVWEQAGLARIAVSSWLDTLTVDESDPVGVTQSALLCDGVQPVQISIAARGERVLEVTALIPDAAPEGCGA